MIYKLPSGLNDFQKEMYIHLIEWKWKYITRTPGIYRKKDRNGVVREYEKDAILPENLRDEYPLIYPTVLKDLLVHKLKFPFKLHEQFHNMASSQAANVNLFLPLLLHFNADAIFRQLKPDFRRLATEELYKGFRIEFWDGNSVNEPGLLRDHSANAGTDSDIGIAYYNEKEELCLWLIEHKLTEKEFTSCGGYKSKLNYHKESCSNSFAAIIANKDLCHYHKVNKYEYWNLTEANKQIFTQAKVENHCPFREGMNQLWRNQLLALGLEQKRKYKNVFFSVVRHPGNLFLDGVLKEYQMLISNEIRFSWTNSAEIIRASRTLNDASLNAWAKWYCDLYMIETN